VSWISMIISAVSSIIGQDVLRAGINFIGREDIGFDSGSRSKMNCGPRLQVAPARRAPLPTCGGGRVPGEMAARSGVLEEGIAVFAIKSPKTKNH